MIQITNDDDGDAIVLSGKHKGKRVTVSESIRVQDVISCTEGMQRMIKLCLGADNRVRR